MQTKIKLAALLNAALLLTGIGNAQTSKPAAVTPPSLQEATSAPQLDQDQGPNTAPVFWIKSVEVLRSTHTPQLDVVCVRGLVTTEGWEAVELVPLTKGTPSDGILDLALIAEAPSVQAQPPGDFSYSQCCNSKTVCLFDVSTRARPRCRVSVMRCPPTVTV